MVKRLARDNLTAMRSMLVELKLAPKDWVYIIDVISTIIIEYAADRLVLNGNGTTRIALEVITGKRLRRALVQIIGDEIGPAVSLSMERGAAERIFKPTQQQAAPRAFHKDVSKRVNAHRHNQLMNTLERPTLRFLAL